jgi:type III secretion protein C
VPYLGALFRNSQTTHERLERLVLITPHIKSMTGEGKANTTLALTGAPMGAAVSTPATAAVRSPANATAWRAQPVPGAAPGFDPALPVQVQTSAPAMPQSSGLSPVSALISPPANGMSWGSRHDR